MSKARRVDVVRARCEVPPNEQGRLCRRPFALIPLLVDQPQGLIHIVADLFAPSEYPGPDSRVTTTL